MHTIRQMLASALFGLAAFASSTAHAESSKVAGLWKVVAFYTEDAVTGERGHFYGRSPIGFMKLETNGRLSAWLASGWPQEPPLSVWEDVAGALDPNRSVYRAVFYAGEYRLNDNALAVSINDAVHEGRVGPGAFDIGWTEGRTRQEELRNFRIETDASERETLHLATAPMTNPNGFGNTIVGHTIWSRASDSEFGPAGDQ